jgi:hypothetical protein
MRRYEFSTLAAVVCAVALFVAVSMLWKTLDVKPIKGVDPSRFTKEQLGPPLDQAVRAMGGILSETFEPLD